MQDKEVKLGRKLEGFASFFGRFLVMDAIFSFIFQKLAAILTLYFLWKFFLKPMWQAATGQPVKI